MSSDITIVTAFYDIGRGEWTPDKGHPSYLHRTKEKYFERFLYLCELKNDIVVVCQTETVKELKEIIPKNKANVKFVVFDPYKELGSLYERIVEVQNSEEFKTKQSSGQRHNPEYWNPDYVFITCLKSFFTYYGIVQAKPSTEMVAWIDFGYCRSKEQIPSSKRWEYNFTPSKIHMFDYKPYDGKDIERIMLDNDVYILGAKVVASKSNWHLLTKTISDCVYDMLDRNMVDDDQGFWLMAALQLRDKIELHRIPDHTIHGDKCFVLFNKFNDTVEETESEFLTITTG